MSIDTKKKNQTNTKHLFQSKIEERFFMWKEIKILIDKTFNLILKHSASLHTKA